MLLNYILNSNLSEDMEQNIPDLLPDFILEIDNHGVVLNKIAPERPSFLFSNPLDIHQLIPDQFELFEHHLQKFNQTQEIQSFQITLVKDKIIHFFEIRLTPNTKDRIILIISELSKRPTYSIGEDNLFVEKENLDITLRSITDGIIAADINGKIIFMNKAAEEITGWNLEEAAGKKLSIVYHTSNYEESHGKGFDFWEYTFLFTKDGQQRVITDNGASIHDRNGNITGLVIVFRDITEKWRMEEEIERTQRLEFIGNLAAGIAHDFNNILSVVLANIQLVKILHTKGGDTGKYLNGMEDAVNRASSLTKQLLTFAKGGAPIKKPALLSDLLMETVELGIKDTKLKCSFSIQEHLWPVEIDPAQISQVFNNLTNNAVQTIPGEGTLEISAQNITVTNQDILALPPGKYIKIIFQDNGPGVAKDKLNKIFDPYYLFGQKGNGLGLAVSYSIIKRHNGLITAQSEPGAGACFTIYLPSVGLKVMIKESNPASNQKGKKILFMDDETHITDLVGQMLNQMDYRVVTAKNGSEALELFRQARIMEEPFDVIIMDLTVPGEMGGREAISHLRELDPDVKAIVSSGYSNDPIMADCQSYGFKGMISKPYKIEELCQEINRVLKG